MTATPYMQKQIKNMRSLQDSVLNSLTDEQVVWSPPGTLSSIGIIWLHMIASEDFSSLN